MENLRIYEATRNVPGSAKKEITAGRLRGMTDINPMWRIKTLTEQFGICGIGWYTEVLDKCVVDGADGEKVAIMDIALYIKDGGEWSKPIYGTGGSMLVASEKNGLHTSDEAYKMAYTDAISVCCKALGFGADVYWEKDSSKYTKQETKADNKPGIRLPPDTDAPVVCECCGKRIADWFDGEALIKANEMGARAVKTYGKRICVACARKPEFR